MATIIPWTGLLWCALPVCLIAGVYCFWTGKISEVLLASARMAVQLILVGYALVFVFSQESPTVSLAIVFSMLIIAAWIAIRPVRQHTGIFVPATVALVVAVSVHLFISLILVIPLDKWYQPNVLIPLAGMYLANSMNSISLSVERYYAERQYGNEPVKARNKAFQAAMIPLINGLLAVGLVSLPGMMTGQILSGVSPLVAVRYQIMIMTMVLGTAGGASALVLWQLTRKDIPSVNKE